MYFSLYFLSFLPIIFASSFPDSSVLQKRGQNAQKERTPSFFILEQGCTCRQNGMPGTLYSGILPQPLQQSQPPIHPSNSTQLLPNIPMTNISLGVAGPPYTWLPYSYLESRALGINRLEKKVYIMLQFYRSDEGGEVYGIFEFNYDGSGRKKILDRVGSSWGGLAVSHDKIQGQRKIYYTEGNVARRPYSGGTRLKRANLDGSDIETIVFPEKMECRLRNSTDVNCPKVSTALDKVELDEERGFVYWSQDLASGIYRARIEMPAGQSWENRTDIEAVAEVSPSQMRAVDEYLYWAAGSQIWRVDVSGHLGGWSKPEPIIKNTTSLTGQALGGLAIDHEGGLIWVVANSGIATLWSVSMDGEDVKDYWLDGRWLNQLKGFEMF